MFKKILVMALVAIPMLVQAQALKLGSVNPSEVAMLMPEYTSAQNAIKQKTEEYDKQIKPVVDEYEKLVAEYQELEKSKAADNLLEAKYNQIADVQKRIQDFRQKASEDLQKDQETFMGQIQQKLNNAIQQVGAEGGYSAIIDAGTLLFRGAQIEDVTPKVKAKLGIK